MDKWIEKLLSNSNDVSHKRLISVLSFIALIGILVLNVYGVIIADSLIYVFFGLCVGNTTLSVLDKKGGTDVN